MTFGARGTQILSVTDVAHAALSASASIAVTEAGSFVVNRADDVTADDGQTSLREAIAFVPESGVSAPTITFDPQVFATKTTITLTQGELLLNFNLKIQGPGANLLTINANNASRVFTVHSRQGTISGLTLTGGNSSNMGGGAVQAVQATLTMNGCVLTGNSASQEGAVDLVGAVLHLIGCTLSNNQSSGRGGAISINEQASADLSNCTLTGNTGTFQPGAIDNAGILSLSNCTLTGNTAPDGGGIVNQGTNGTLTPQLTLSNCILAGNSTSDLINQGISVSNGYNLLGVTQGAPTSSPGDQSGVATSQLHLGPLQDNGGPTPTVALLLGSIAVNAGNSTLATDQRGTPRPQGSAPDIGAFEFNYAGDTSSLLVSTTDDLNDGDLRAGHLSLREAIGLANFDANPSTISFDPTVFASPQTITLAQKMALPTPTSDLTINGPKSGVLVVAKVGAPVLSVPSGVTLNLSGLSLSGGRNSVQNAGTLTVSNGSFSNTLNDLVNTGTATLTNTRLSNSAIAIQNSGTLTANGCLFFNNTTGLSNAQGASAEVQNSTLSVSTSAVLSSGSLTLRGSTLTGNSQGVQIQAGTALVAQCTFVSNSGAVIGTSGATLTVNRCTISGNGMGLSTGGANTTLRNTLLVSNSTNLSGTATRAYNLLNATATQAGLETDGNGFPLLKDNGGPTATVALLAGSSVINRADPGIMLGFDQRGTGFARAVGGRADIGAFEFQGTAPSTASASKSSAPSS